MIPKNTRRWHVRRMDSALILAALATAGIAAVLFWVAWRSDRNDEQEEATQTATFTLTPTITLSPTLTLSPTASPTSTETPTRLPTDTPTHIPTATATPTFTDTPTPTLTFTPYPVPIVNPITLAETYAGEAITITGRARRGDTIILLDNGEAIAEVEAQRSGDWEIKLSEGLEVGSHRLELFAVSEAGEQSAVVPLGFIVNTAPTATPTRTPTRTPRPTDTPEPTQEVGLLPSNTAPVLILPSLTPSRTPRSTDTTEPTQEVGLLPTLTPSLTPTTTPSVTATPTNTPDKSLLPATATPTATVPSQTPSQTPSLTPTPTLTSTSTATFTPTPTERLTEAALAPTEQPGVTPTATALPPLQPPRFDTPRNPYSPFAPVLISGSAEPNVTVTLHAGEELLGTAVADVSGQWRFQWEGETRSTVIEAIAADETGRSSPPARANFLVEITDPRITEPRSGITITPGLLAVRGSAPALAPLSIVDQSGAVLAETAAGSDGDWAALVQFNTPQQITLQAVIFDSEGRQPLAASSGVRVRVAESIAPATGGLLDEENARPDRMYTALLALLLTAAGFTFISIGRALYLRSRRV